VRTALSANSPRAGDSRVEGVILKQSRVARTQWGQQFTSRHGAYLEVSTISTYIHHRVRAALRAQRVRSPGGWVSLAVALLQGGYLL